MLSGSFQISVSRSSDWIGCTLWIWLCCRCCWEYSVAPAKQDAWPQHCQASWGALQRDIAGVQEPGCHIRSTGYIDRDHVSEGCWNCSKAQSQRCRNQKADTNFGCFVPKAFRQHCRTGFGSCGLHVFAFGLLCCFGCRALRPQPHGARGQKVCFAVCVLEGSLW